jgi:hypothetical protein
MKNTALTLLTLTAMTITAAAPAIAQSPREDAERLLALCAEHCEAFDLIHGNSMYYGGVVDQARGLARVYELSAVTTQGNPGATPKKPPFGAYWVGDSWTMRLKNL